ncbi:hypothetical protein J9978_10210 [Chromobacterium violaceum]|uniref:hypothetical protein n=1 Tax=Chromobacterium violaceum TaxID=536 RepID=UPI001B328D98|nr:hypothetical protein [Chromobacterium violaceum]MBP4049874.1 hypothetical protein [Chromobacterium violaceum]
MPEANALFQGRATEFLDGRREAKFFYVARVYRYERPQAGHYREFTPLGFEYLSDDLAASQPHEPAALPGFFEQPGAALSARQRGSARTQLLPERRGIRNARAGNGRAETGDGRRRLREGAGFGIGLGRLALSLEAQGIPL